MGKKHRPYHDSRIHKKKSAALQQPGTFSERELWPSYDAPKPTPAPDRGGLAGGDYPVRAPRRS